MFVPGPETTAIKSNGQAKTKARSDLAPSEVSIGIYQALNTPVRSHFGVFPHVESNKQQNNSWWILISLWNQNSNQVRTGADKLKRALGLLVTASHARQTRNRGKQCRSLVGAFGENIHPRWENMRKLTRNHPRHQVPCIFLKNWCNVAEEERQATLFAERQTRTHSR